jgi:hypothetical protein
VRGDAAAGTVPAGATTGAAPAGEPTDAAPDSGTTGAAPAGEGTRDTGPDAAGLPRVLLVVVHWNGLDHSTRCLQSLARLTYPARQLLVVDTASSDGSGAELARRFPDIEIFRSPENRFYGGGANLGLRRALSGGFDHAILLNNDTEVAPDLVERLIEVADGTPNVGLVGPKIFHADQPELIWSAGGRIEYWRGMMHHLGLRQPDGPAFAVEREVDYLTGCCLMVARRVIVEVGYLDTTYQMYSEDADYCVRARDLGFGVRFAPRARVWHRVSAASGGGLTPYKMYHRVRSNLMFLRRHARPYHWLTIPLSLPFEFMRFAVRRDGGRRRGVLGAGLRALLDLVRRAPRRAP